MIFHASRDPINEGFLDGGIEVAMIVMKSSPRLLMIKV